jgi:hypothetical protein
VALTATEDAVSEDEGFNMASLRKNVTGVDNTIWLNIEPAERLARLRSLRVLIMLRAREQAKLYDALRRAEKDADVLVEAERLLDEMPALTRRHVLASYAKLVEPVV